MLNTPQNAFQRTERAITFKNAAEGDALELMLKELETNLGENKDDAARLAKFNRLWGLIGDDGSDWADKLLQRMQEDVTVLSKIAGRLTSFGGDLETSIVEVQIGNRIKQEAMRLQKRINEISSKSTQNNIVWKNEIYFFVMKAQGLNGTMESRHLSVVEVPEKDRAGRHARDLHLHLFAPIF